MGKSGQGLVLPAQNAKTRHLETHFSRYRENENPADGVRFVDGYSNPGKLIEIETTATL